MAFKGLGSKTEYTVRYSDMHGVDLSGDGSGIDSHRFAYLENMYRDYLGSSSGTVESIPGFRRIAELGTRINGIHRHALGDGEEYIIVHAGSALYRFNKNDRDALGTLTPILSGLRNKRSCSYTKGGSLFITDGSLITRISGNGTVLRMLGMHSYTPTTFKNGEPHEQRNIASQYFRETYKLSDPARLTRRSEHLIFEDDGDGKSCILTATDEDVTGEIYIPAYAKIGDRLLRVRAIGDYAFYGRTNVSSVHFADGITEIGRYAFGGCSGISEIECSPSTASVGDGAFADCTGLTDVYIGKKPDLIGTSPFGASVPSGLTVKLGTDAADALGIVGIDQLAGMTVVYRAESPKECYAIPILTPIESADGIESIMLGNSVLTSYSISNKLYGDVPRYLYFISRRSAVEAKELTLNGVIASGSHIEYEEKEDFAVRSGTDTAVLAGCTVTASFGGHIFLAGNPKYPNTVFVSTEPKYGEPDDLYFGSVSYFDDGVADYNTVAIVPVKDTLAVFKSGDDGGGAIFCHEVKVDDSFVGMYCPVLNIHTGFDGIRAACPFFDEAVFLSDSGVFSLERGTQGYAKVTHRSSPVDPHLAFSGAGATARFTRWMGYLVLALGESILLADPRAGTTSSGEYAWYILKGIGSWKDDVGVYRYSGTSPEGYELHPSTDAEAVGTVYSADNENGERIYFIADRNGTYYAVYPTGERRGGTFYPATVVLSDGEALFFGTDSGDLLVFNNDKRGEAPERIASAADFDAEEYSADMSERIHPEFYSFAGHAPRYALKTKADNCGAPHLSKSTLKNSLAIKFGSGGAHVSVEIVTDGESRRELHELSARRMDFSDIDFSSLSFETAESFSIGVSDKSRSWTEKQISIYSDEYNSPISVGAIGYRFKSAGKIKSH